MYCSSDEKPCDCQTKAKNSVDDKKAVRILTKGKGETDGHS